MKKLLALIMVLAMLLCSCNGNNNNSNDTTNDTTITDGYVHQYDENGKITGSVLYENGVEVSQLEYTYDDAGNLILLKTIADGELVQTITHEYEENVLVSTTKEFTDVEDGVLCKEYSKLDAEGKAFFTTYYEDGERVGCESYTYNDDDDLIRKDNVDEDGEVISSEVYTYNQVNQIIRTDCYEFGLLVFYYEYEYDSMGDMSKATMYEPDGTMIGEIN